MQRDGSEVVIARQASEASQRSNLGGRGGFLAAVLVAAAPFANAADPVPRIIKAHFTPKQQQVDRYVQVPFDVAQGTTRIDIDLKYDRANGDNVVDLGLLEPGSLELGTRAFRGWTGGERSTIFVSASDATPGYWPGPIQAGQWNVGLGLYKVGASGVDVEVTVRTSSAPITEPMPSLPARAKEPIKTGEGWYSGALHAHTHNSDGALSAQALAEKARAEGLDFLAITDHNNTAHQREAIDVPGLLTIVGEEVTTPGGHANVWGLGGVRDFVDFRVQAGDRAIKSFFAAAAARGALMGINHPYGDCVACNWTHDVPDGASTIEITSRDPGEVTRAMALWDSILRQGRHLTAIGVRDWHRGDAPIGAASVRVWAKELSTAAILDGIRNGRVVVMLDATTAPPSARLVATTEYVPNGIVAGVKGALVGEAITIEAEQQYHYLVDVEGSAYTGARVDLYWNGERIATAPLVNGRARFDRFAGSSGYLRATIFSAAGAPIAIINPILINIIGH